MTGLLIKDWKLLTHQGRYFMTIIVIALLLLIFGKGNYFSFATSYVVWMFAYFTLSTLNYDEYDNGMPFLMTLPIRRREYVKEKYLFGYLLTATAWIFMLVIGSAYLLFTDGMDLWEDYCISETFILLFILCFLALAIPMQLKFGAEKGRMVMILVVVLCGVGILQAGTFLMPAMGDLGWLLPDFLSQSVGWLLGACLAACLLVTGISYGCSLKIMKKRQF